MSNEYSGTGVARQQKSIVGSGGIGHQVIFILPAVGFSQSLVFCLPDSSAE